MNDDFQPDNMASCEDENLRLRDLLRSVWRNKCIDTIKRQRSPEPPGWYATFVDNSE